MFSQASACPQGACMAVGVCMAGWHVWQGTCMTGGMHGGGHVWQGVWWGHAWQGHVWQGACMAGGMRGRGHAWHAHPWQIL